MANYEQENQPKESFIKRAVTTTIEVLSMLYFIRVLTTRNAVKHLFGKA